MGGGKGFGAFGGTQGSNQRERLLSTVSNSSLRNAIKEIYREGATVGDGGTTDAICVYRICPMTQMASGQCWLRRLSPLLLLWPKVGCKLAEICTEL
ncbi:MAG: hypothetical protein FWG02_01295 [Holophagaceae bacterium]|nr:hypothetical protein [Holophagaceae bacterium]